GLRQARLVVAARAPQLTLHVFFHDRECALLAQSDAALASPHPMGILRLRMPAQAPSRSSWKLDEALLLLVGEERLGARMKPGAQAVDLGAAPGGWSWQLAQRGLRVMAVDNAKLAPAVLATPLVG